MIIMDAKSKDEQPTERESKRSSYQKDDLANYFEFREVWTG